MPLRRGRWIRDPASGELYRFCTIDGNEFKQIQGRKGEEDSFLDASGSQINRTAAEALGLLTDQQPRSVLGVEVTGSDQSTGTPLDANISYGHVSSRAPVPTLAPRDDILSQGEDVNEDFLEGGDRVPDLPRNRQYLDERNINPRSLNKDAAADLLTTIARTGSLPDDYIIQVSGFFRVGRVFRVFYVQPLGATHPQHRRDDDVFRTFRPMIVVKKHPAHCICLPIFSYGNQGTIKDGLTATEIQHHAVVHMLGKTPRLLPTEESNGNISLEDAFTVHPAEGASLSGTSRVRFDRPYPVDYNIKVRDLGVILRAHRRRLIERWMAAN